MTDCPSEKSLKRRHHSESSLRHRDAAAAIGGGVANQLISNQLSLEHNLQDKCRELLCLYKESQDWSAVGQLAQTLVTSSARASDLKRRLQDPEHLPYLEKIVEPGQSQLKEASPTPTSLKDGATGGEECLCKSTNGSQGSVNKQEVLKSSDLSAIGVQSVGCVTSADGLEVEGLKCEGALEKNCDSVEISEGVGVVISPTLPFINTTDHINFVNPTEGVKESDLDELEDQMEHLANQFTDLTQQYNFSNGEVEQEDLKASDLPVTSALVTDSNETGLEVPEQLKAIYASSDSSDQFFSPRNSLYGDVAEKEADQFEDTDQFEDASSGGEDAMDSTLTEPDSSFEGCGGGKIVFFVEKVSEDLNDIYSIKTNKGAPSVLHSYHEFIQLQRQLASSVGSGSVLVMESEGRECDVSTELETFLNKAACLPEVRKMDTFVNFLQHGGANLSNHYGMFMIVWVIIHRILGIPAS